MVQRRGLGLPQRVESMLINFLLVLCLKSTSSCFKGACLNSICNQLQFTSPSTEHTHLWSGGFSVSWSNQVAWFLTTSLKWCGFNHCFQAYCLLREHQLEIVWIWSGGFSVSWSNQVAWFLTTSLKWCGFNHCFQAYCLLREYQLKISVQIHTVSSWYSRSTQHAHNLKLS